VCTLSQPHSFCMSYDVLRLLMAYGTNMYLDWWEYIYVASCWHTSVAMLIYISDKLQRVQLCIEYSCLFFADIWQLQ